MTNIVVLGAGVTGLTVAHELLQNPNNKVTIVSKNFPTDFKIDKCYTSPIAGANWQSFASNDDKFVQNIDTVGYKKFKKLIKNNPECGVTNRKNRNYITKLKFDKEMKGEKEFPWFSDNSKLDCNFRELDQNELIDGMAYGFEYDGFVIRTSYYLTFLINQMWKISGYEKNNFFNGIPGVKSNSRLSLRRKSVSSLAEAKNYHHLGKADLVINCAGLAARELADLEESEKLKLKPIRGVVFVAENNVGLDRITIVETGDDEPEHEELYIMPRREGELIIGGCFQVGNESQDVDSALKDRILGRCKKYLTQYNWDQIKIVREQVGFRPYREGGYRIQRIGNIIHCYGMAGAGFQSSWGCAQQVLKLTNEEVKAKL